MSFFIIKLHLSFWNSPSCFQSFSLEWNSKVSELLNCYTLRSVPRRERRPAPRTKRSVRNLSNHKFRRWWGTKWMKAYVSLDPQFGVFVGESAADDRKQGRLPWPRSTHNRHEVSALKVCVQIFENILPRFAISQPQLLPTQLHLKILNRLHRFETWKILFCFCINP